MRYHHVDIPQLIGSPYLSHRLQVNRLGNSDAILGDLPWMVVDPWQIHSSPKNLGAAPGFWLGATFLGIGL